MPNPLTLAPPPLPLDPLEPYEQRWLTAVAGFVKAGDSLSDALIGAAHELIPFNQLALTVQQTREGWRVAARLCVPVCALDVRVRRAKDAELGLLYRAGLLPLQMPPLEVWERYDYGTIAAA